MKRCIAEGCSNEVPHDQGSDYCSACLLDDAQTELITVYTTAPQSYDYPCVHDTGETVLNSGGITFRVLTSYDKLRVRDYQLPRYWSGLYAAVISGTTEAERFGLP